MSRGFSLETALHVGNIMRSHRRLANSGARKEEAGSLE
jgi:hypothetical protein